ncbi:MAG: winged helix-turn-helix transcriptional regulator [Clostridiales bacterium]|nr:winged helix-turn-helix transcriptional regulator [Clostridiales bacterium]
MQNSKLISKVREFNRLYMPTMKLLGNHYLGSEYSVPEARVFFEIYENEGCNAAHIAEKMNIDKSYLSKIISSHEKSGYIIKKPSSTDKRAYDLYLTVKGKERTLEFIRDSNNEIGNILTHLSVEEQQKMYAALEIVMDLLRKKV